MREIFKAVRHNVSTSLTHLDKTVNRTNRELVYGAIACAAVGMVIGMLMSPKKEVTVGSYNGPRLAQPEEEDRKEEQPGKNK